MRLHVLLALLLVLPLSAAPGAAAQTLATLDVQDPARDVIVSPRSGSDSIGARDAVDLLRVRQSVEGDAVVVRLTFAAPPGEPGSHMLLMTSFSQNPGEGASFGFDWDTTGKLVRRDSNTSYVSGGEFHPANATIALEGDDAVITIVGVAPTMPCFAIGTFSFGVRASDRTEYTDWFYTPVNPCDPADRLDGASGSCPASPQPPADRVALDLEDAEGDVRTVSGLGEEKDTVDDGMRDIVKVTSRRVGERIEQSVTLAEPLNASAELRVEVISRVAGGQDRDREPEDAFIARYWRFANGAQADRVEGEILRKGSSAPVDAYVTLDVEGSTYTFGWCASLLPASIPCFDVEAEATVSTFLSGGVRDDARPLVPACAAAAPATSTPRVTPDEGTGEDEEAGEEPQAGANESPLGLPVALLAVALAVLVARRR